jgi:hypothetical protein
MRIEVRSQPAALRLNLCERADFYKPSAQRVQEAMQKRCQLTGTCQAG